MKNNKIVLATSKGSHCTTARLRRKEQRNHLEGIGPREGKKKEVKGRFTGTGSSQTEPGEEATKRKNPTKMGSRGTLGERIRIEVMKFKTAKMSP